MLLLYTSWKNVPDLEYLLRGGDVDEGGGLGCWLNPLRGPLALKNVDLCSSPLLITYHKSDVCGCTCRRAFSGLECSKKCQSFCRSCSDHTGTRAPDCSSGPFNLMRSLPPPHIIQLGAVQRVRRRRHHKEQNGDEEGGKGQCRKEKNCRKDGKGLYRKQGSDRKQEADEERRRKGVRKSLVLFMPPLALVFTFLLPASCFTSVI